MRVLKFGGTSVADAACIDRVVAIVARGAAAERVVVVVSAMAGVTDSLEAAILAAVREGDWGEAFADALQARHLRCLQDLCGGRARGEAVRALAARLAELDGLLAGVRVRGECPAPARDRILAVGERLSVVLVSEALREAGLPARAFDGAELIVTDSRFGEAAVRWPETERRVAARLGAIARDVVPVVTGFVGGDDQGRTTTLGRGGSDTSASLLGAALGAAAVEIWTDVDGVLSAPPFAGVADRTLPRLSYDEATQLARFGGKVLHPATMAPVAERGIPILVRNTFNPEGPRTEISHVERGGGTAVAASALAAAGQVALIGRALTTPALAIQRELLQAGIPVLAHVATGSPHAIAVEVPLTEVVRAVGVLHAAFVERWPADGARRAASTR